MVKTYCKGILQVCVSLLFPVNSQTSNYKHSSNYNYMQVPTVRIYRRRVKNLNLTAAAHASQRPSHNPRERCARAQ